MKSIESFRKHLIREGLATTSANTYAEAITDYRKRYNTLTKTNVLEWKDGLASRYKPYSIATRIKGMNAYLVFNDMDFRLSSIKMKKVLHLNNVISVADYHKLVNGLSKKGDPISLKWRLLYMTMAMTGMRVSEVIQVKAEEVHGGRIQVYAKGRIYRTILLPRKLIKEIEKYLKSIGQDKGYIFGKTPDSHYAIGTIEARMHMHGDLFNLPKEVMHPHSLRHMFGKNFMKNRGDITVLADLLGHSSIETTRIYTRRSIDEQMEAIDRIVTW